MFGTVNESLKLAYFIPKTNVITVERALTNQ